MLAFLVCVAALVFWGVTGFALLSTLSSRRRPLEHFLLAPAVGLALTVVCLFLLNRLGFPIRRVGWPLSIGLLVLSAIVLWLRRASFPLGRIAPFAGLALAALLLIGWPFFRFGFDWISYGNDDGSNYALWAQCALEHGWYDPVEASDLAEGRDGSRIFVFAYGCTGERPGAQLLLAWLASLSGRTTLAVMMPTLLAMHGGLILAAGALVYRGRWRRLTALAACVLVGVSAPLSLGTLNQLMGQTGGLALLCASSALLFRSVGSLGWRHLLRRALLLGAMLSGFLVYYSELVPFVGLGFVLYQAVSWYRRRHQPWPALVSVGGAFAVAVVALQDYFLIAMGFILQQVGHGTSGDENLRQLFPYYLHPTGLASLWSFQCFHVSLPNPWLSGAIVTGFVLLVLSAILAVRHSWRAQPVAILCCILLAMTAAFYAKGSAFGLFKLAMYLQPFLLGTLALGWARLGRWRWLALAPLLLFAWTSARTQNSYAQQSFGKHVMVEMKSASEDAIFRLAREQMRSSDADCFIVASDSSFTAKILATSNDGRPLRVPTYPYLSRNVTSLPNLFLSQEQARQFEQLGTTVQAAQQDYVFDLHDPADPARSNEFLAPDPEKSRKPARPAVVYPSGRLTIFNRWHHPEATTRGLEVRPLDELCNHLVLVSSELGKQYMVAGGDPNVAAYQLESDYFYPQRTMASLGRDLLFEVLSPTPRSRMLIQLTTSLAANGDCSLPEAAVIGRQRVKLPLTGRGAARVIAEPVEPQPIAGNHYVALDLGDRKFRFRSGLNFWDRISRVVAMDRRELTAFGRDISLLTEGQYATLKPPTMVANFGEDLKHPDLEFSGLYEDGWLSEHAWFRPSSGGADADLVIEGVVPQIDTPMFRTTLTVLVDGREIARRELSPGPFELRQAMSALPARPKVELIFSQAQTLPGGDNRIAAGQLRRLGFRPAQ